MHFAESSPENSVAMTSQAQKQLINYVTGQAFCAYIQTACSLGWFVVAKSIVDWFVVREKHC
jgi:hypothetical protein